MSLIKRQPPPEESGHRFRERTAVFAPAPRPFPRLNPPQRTLFGPDLSNPSPRAVQGLIASIEGAHDPDFRRVHEEATRLAAGVFQVDDGEVVILPLLEDATREVVCRSFLAPGDPVVVGRCGLYGDRLEEAARRAGARPIVVSARPGEAVPHEAMHRAIRDARPRAVLLAHGEGSTGVLQPLEGLAEACRQVGALLLVDASFTLGGVDLRCGAWGVDVAWSGTQRCLSAVAGLTLVALGPRALEALPPADGPLHLCHTHDGGESFPAPLLYAVAEVLQLCHEQGLEYRFRRHRNRHAALLAGLEALGLEIVAHPAVRLPTVTAVRVPPGVDGEEVRRTLLRRFRLEIGGPADPATGPVWRVGVMGHSAAPATLLLLLAALEVLLEERGWTVDRGAAIRAALATLEW